MIIDEQLVRRLQRAYDLAIRNEEGASTERQAWRLAARSEWCLRQLQAARAGLPLPEPRIVAPRIRGRQGLAVLATIGRTIHRAIVRDASLRKARASAARRRALTVVRHALRRTVGAIASAARSSSAQARSSIKLRPVAAAYRVKRDDAPTRPVCAVEGCPNEGTPHRCPADGTLHHHGMIHYHYCHTTLVFRPREWNLICDQHYEVCVTARREAEMAHDDGHDCSCEKHGCHRCDPKDRS